MKLYRNLCLLLALLLLSMCGGAALAVTDKDKDADKGGIKSQTVELPFQRMVQLVVNDRILEECGTIEDGHVLVPLRHTFEAMGAQVSFKGKNIEISKGNNLLKLSLGSSKCTLNGIPQSIGKTLTASNGTTWLPLRFFVNVCGSYLEWNEAHKIAYLYSYDFGYGSNDKRWAKITDVTVSPKRPLVTGDKMLVEVLGYPSAKVDVEISGIEGTIPAYEDRPGRYLATLAITDMFSADSAAVTAHMDINGNRASLVAKDKVFINHGKAIADPRAQLRIYPQHNEVINERRPKITADYRGLPLDGSSLRFFFDGVEFTHQLVHRHNTVMWHPSDDLAYGTHSVKLLAKDNQGKALRTEWFFTVTFFKQDVDASSGHELPQISLRSPLSGDGVPAVFSVRGRTLPLANVTITVSEETGKVIEIDSAPSIMLTKQVQADVLGDFEAEFDTTAVRAGHRLSVRIDVESGGYNGKPLEFQIVRR